MDGRRNPPRAPKTITRVIVVVMLGAIVNVAVAWGVAPHGDLGQWSVSNEGSPFWLMQGHGGWGASFVRVTPIYAQGRDAMPMQALARGGPAVNPRVLARFTDAPTRKFEYLRYGFDERGWPLRCLHSEHRFRWTNRPGAMLADVKVTGGIQLWPEQTARGGWGLQRVRALPLWPIWPAFVGNTILYAALAGIVLWGYPAMVRMLGAQRSMRRALLAAMLAPGLVVAVAWAAAWNGGRSLNEGGQRVSAAEKEIDGSSRHLERQDRLGATRLVFSAGNSNFGGVERLPAPPIDGVAPRWSQPAWADASQRPWRSFQWLTAEGAGWPARALSSSFESRAMPDLTINVTIHRGILIDQLPQGFDVGAPFTLRILPTQVLCAGCAVNWALYAFVLFGFLMMPGALKRGLRLRRGRCPECGYDLRGEFNAGCPECGWNRQDAAAQA